MTRAGRPEMRRCPTRSKACRAAAGAQAGSARRCPLTGRFFACSLVHIMCVKTCLVVELMRRFYARCLFGAAHTV